MAGKGSTAEHQLLRAIEKGSPGGAPSSKDSAGKRKIPLERFFEAIDLAVGKISKVDFKELFDVPNVKKMLTGLVVVLIAVYSIMLLKGLVKIQNVPRFEVSDIKEVSGLAKVQLPVRSHEYYIDKLVGRNIFKAGAVKETQEEIVQVEPRINEKAKELKLVGISWSPDPNERYVMIEDMNTELTYHVRENERFLDFTVKNIEQEYVTLGSGNEEMDLR